MFMGWKKGTFDAALLGEDAPHRTVDGSNYTAGAGILSGTNVATPQGWRGVEAVAVGDDVMTFDGGFQRVIGISRSLLWAPIEDCPEALWPIRVAEGVIGNRRALQLLPDEIVMIESDLAEQLFDDPFALIAAQALENLPGVERVPPEGYVEVVTLSFEQDELIFVEGAALVLCQSIGAGATMSLDALLADDDTGYHVLSLGDAKLVAQHHLMVAQGSASIGLAA